MTSPDAKQSSQDGGGGLLPAVLAGAGILLVAGLLIFGGDDEKQAERSKDDKAQSAAGLTSSGKGKAGVAARQADAPNTAKTEGPKVNPRIANAIVTGGMSSAPPKEEPSSFGSSAEEIAYWEGELREANRMLEIRERAVESIPKTEEAIRNGNDPVNGLKEFEKRKEVVKANLEKAQKRVEDVEAKLAELRGE
ncbi:MAG: hypothetical protein HC927_08680 [Deltaproteobacteria bacterium]|nr:hypothetical protein [Deltaproteobacteria bacterium]